MSSPDIALPRNYDELAHALAARPGAVIVGGGTALLPTVSASTARDVICVAFLPPLTLDRRTGTHQLSSAARLFEIADTVRLPAALRIAAASVGGPAVRNRATIGGNVCNTGGPRCLRVAALALDAEVDLVGADGRLGWHRLSTPLPGRAVTVGIRWPADRSRRTAFVKIRGNGIGGAVLVSVAVSAIEGADHSLRIAVGGGQLSPQRAWQAETIANHAHRARSSAVLEAVGQAAAECLRAADLGLQSYLRRILAVACEDAVRATT